MFSIKDGRNELNQWEQGQVLVNPHMKTGDKVFFHSATGETCIMYATADGVEVPNVLLQTARPMTVDLEGRPTCRTRICVKPAEKPNGYALINNVMPHAENTFGVVGAGDKLEWNGDKNTPSVGLGFDGNSIGTFYKVSDNIITREDLANGFSVAGYFMSIYGEMTSANFLHFAPIEEKEDGTLLIPVPDENGNYYYPMYVVCVPNGALYEPGVYFGANFHSDMITFDRVVSITIPGYGKFPVKKPVAVEHLPAPLSFAETHGFTNTLTWNGSYEGLEVHSDPNQSDWYKLSDVVVTVEDLANGLYAEVVTPGDIYADTYYYGVSQGAFLLDTTNPSDIQIHVFDENGNSWPAMRFTTDGVFVTHWKCWVTNWETGQTNFFDNIVYSITIPGFNKFPATTNRTIDKKYLPKAEVVYDLPEDFPVTGLEFNELLRALKKAGYLAK